MNSKSKVKEFLARYFNVDSITDDENYFEKGLVSSLFSMQLLMFLEGEFNIEINNDEINPDYFKTINSIVGFLNAKGVPE